MKEYQFPFEKLAIWQESRIMVSKIYKATASFPKEEQFGLTAQIRRAIVSVASNIAEGESRLGQKDQLRFLVIAYSSLMEVLNQLILATDLQMLQEIQLKELRDDIGSLSNKINALYNYRKGKSGGNG